MTKPLRPQDGLDDEEPYEDSGRSLGLRLLAFVGAFSFLMLGVSSVVMPLMDQTDSLPAANRRPASGGQSP